MSTYVTHEEGLDPVFQTFLEVARSRANMSASHSLSLHPHDYELAAQHLESLETSAAEFGAKMQHHLATHRRVLNALLPIHRIPSEIFTEILAMSLVLWSEDANEKYQEHLYTLRVMQEGPSADQVDIILRASPALVELILQAVYPRGDDAPPIKQRHPVELLSLRKLTVVRLTHELTTHILENIRIPNCENIIILAETSTKAAYTPSQSFLHSAHKIMGASDSARVELGAQLFSLKCWKQGEIALKVCLRGEAWAFNTAESFLRLLDPSLDLSIIIDTNSPNLTKIFNLLPSLGGARALQLTQHRQAVYDGSNALISELGVVKMAKGVFRWPLPLLETLRVRSSSLEVGALLGVIRARLEAEVEPPSKLKALHLAKNLKRYFRELENTLGEGVVSCYNSGLDSYELFGGSESGSEPDCIVDEESESDAEGEDEDESDLETEAQLHYQYRGRSRR
ncbi:hypothetical protein FRB97_007139 [Tulasnella sp. 331]|nr:hypothetical protein FRB97_007139 [Tulasnella sp. 331]